MLNLFKLAARNLMRYKRRTLLTTMLVTLGVVSVLLFMSLTGSFKALMIGQITDSMIGHLQIHKKGYLASIDSLPLDRNLTAGQIDKVVQVLASLEEVESWSLRIRLGAMFSNFAETTNIRLNAVIPQAEVKTVPLLPSRILQGEPDGLLKPGEILVPELIARGMQVKVGDGVVLVANNRDGSVNGQTLMVRGVLEGISGPGGRDGIIHLEDAQTLLRIDAAEISEVAVRIKALANLHRVEAQLSQALAGVKSPQGNPVFEVHSWEQISPFFNIARMIDVMTLFIKIMLVAIVLVSIMNVMIMAVYERINEIGTISAIGTLPRKILGLFVIEGFLLGLLGTVLGLLISLVSIAVMNVTRISFDFGRQTGLLLAPTIALEDVLSVALLVIVMAVAASLQPAWKASRMDPITALKHV